MSTKKVQRKYLTEFTLNVFSSEPAILVPADLDKLADETEEAKAHIKNSNIYLILKRPRISFIPSSLRIVNNVLQGEIGIQTESELITKKFILKNNIPNSVAKFKASKYPHTKLILLDSKDNEVFTYPMTYLLNKMEVDLEKLGYLNVAYVGQAFGASGERTAVERLATHSTLQKILADITANQPNEEVFLALYQFEFHRFLFNMDGTVKVKIDGDADKEHYEKVLESKFKRKMRISLAEAALIRYFQPKYNKDYKKEFPLKRHKILKKLYDFDFSALVVEACVEDLGLQLYSDTIKHSAHHIARFDLHDKKERRSFFFDNPK